MTLRACSTPTIAGRVPPHDTDAEQAVLSAVLSDRDALDRVLEVLAPEHFYSEQNQIIFTACRELSLNGQAIDYVTANSWLRSRELTQRAGGIAYLAQLVDATPAVAHVLEHARVVKEKWRVRRVISVCQKYAAEGYGDVGPVQEWIDEAEGALLAVSEAEATESEPKRVGVVLKAEMDRQADESAPAAWSTGYPTLDGMLDGGWRPGKLYILAARPGMGKSALMGDLCCEQANMGHAASITSLEMPEDELLGRIVCRQASVGLGAWQAKRLTANDWQAISAQAGAIHRWPLWIDAPAQLTLMGLRSRVRRIKREAAQASKASLAGGGPPIELRLVAVDYVQLMGHPGAQSREQEVSAISRGLKAMAKEQNVAVLALAQLNRDLEKRGANDRRPRLSDLRESGSLEQDADVVAFLYRPGYYLALEGKRDDTDGRSEVIFAKHRGGPTGVRELRFFGASTTFREAM